MSDGNGNVLFENIVLAFYKIQLTFVLKLSPPVKVRRVRPRFRIGFFDLIERGVILRKDIIAPSAVKFVNIAAELFA